MTTTQHPTRAKRSRGPDSAAVLDRLGIEATNAGAWTLAPIDTSGPTPRVDQPRHRRADRRRPPAPPPTTTSGSPRVAVEAFREWRDLAGAAARRGRAPARRRAARPQGGARPPGHARGRQDPLRGAGRGAGDDRHGRLRRRPVAPALRPDHALRAAAATACTSSGIRSGRSASSPPSTSRSRCGPGTRWSRRSAATR